MTWILEPKVDLLEKSKLKERGEAAASRDKERRKHPAQTETRMLLRAREATVAMVEVGKLDGRGHLTRVF